MRHEKRREGTEEEGEGIAVGRGYENAVIRYITLYAKKN